MDFINIIYKTRTTFTQRDREMDNNHTEGQREGQHSHIGTEKDRERQEQH